MSIKRVKPINPQPVVTPQCCVEFDAKQYAKHYLERRKRRCQEQGLDFNKCTRPSSYLIEDKPYCTQHAGRLVLDMLAAGAWADYP